MKYKLVTCNMELDWQNDGNVCRDKIGNNINSVRSHMIRKHGWNIIPQAEQEHRIHRLYDEKLIEFYEQNPKEWFSDNQLIYTEFKKQHFKLTENDKREDK